MPYGFPRAATLRSRFIDCLLLWPEDGLNSLSSHLIWSGPDHPSRFKVVAATHLKVLRHCVIHRYASFSGHARGLLKLRNLLAREGVEQLAEQLANRMISYLILDLYMDHACVSGETFGKGAGQGARSLRQLSKREIRAAAQSVRATYDSLASQPGRINSPTKRPGRDKRSSGSWCWLGWSGLDQVLVCMPWIRKSK